MKKKQLWFGWRNKKLGFQVERVVVSEKIKTVVFWGEIKTDVVQQET